MESKVGKILEVIIDEVSNGAIIGRTKGDAPEIDGIVTIKAGQCITSGDVTEVEITSFSDYDLIGSLVN